MFSHQQNMAGKKNKLHSRPPFPCHLLFSAPSTHTQYQLHNKLPAFTISHVNIRVLVGATAWTLIPMWNINRLPSKCAICKSIYNWAKCDTYRIRHWFSNFLCCRPAFFRIRPPPPSPPISHLSVSSARALHSIWIIIHVHNSHMHTVRQQENKWKPIRHLMVCEKWPSPSHHLLF